MKLDSKKGAVATALTLGLALAALSALPFAGAAKPAGDAKYIGVDKCKNCHKVEENGNQYGHWEKSGHAKAFETLASDEAKRIAKEKGIEDPQKAEACLKCHTTAFGVAESEIKKGFDAKKGVQCEVCHGPGEEHMKTRMKEAAANEGNKERIQIPAGEMITKIEASKCTGCHNSESPTFKGFCVHAYGARQAHHDPRKDHSADKMICGCDAKEGCKHVCDDACGGKNLK
jgi:hypothetical protein